MVSAHINYTKYNLSLHGLPSENCLLSTKSDYTMVDNQMRVKAWSWQD